MKKKVILIIIIVVILGIASFFIYKKVKKSGSSTQTGTTSSSDFPLKQGSKGANVTILQNMLNKIIPAELEADGIFGPKTEADLYKKIGLKQLTKNQFEELKTIMSGYTLGTGLYDYEIKKIQNA